MNTDVTFLPIKMMVERVSKSKDCIDPLILGQNGVKVLDTIGLYSFISAPVIR